MDKKIILRVITVILILVMLVPCMILIASATDEKNVPEWVNEIYRGGRTPEEQAEYDSLKWQMYWETETSYVRGYMDEIDKHIKDENENAQKKKNKEKIDNIEKTLSAIKSNIPNIVSIYKDVKNGGDFDTAMLANSILTLGSDIAAVFGPYGQAVAIGLDVLNILTEKFLGGEEGLSELQQIEDRLTQQLEEIQTQLTGIEEEIAKISNEINDSANRIIREISTAINNADSKAYLRTFMNSGEGNFSYNQYRNYINGSLENNSKSNTAYYALLQNAKLNGSSNEIIKKYYDKLYSAIINNRDIFYDYVVGENIDNGIVRHYYDVLAANPGLVDEGKTPELMAIMFAYDLLQTEIEASGVIYACHVYQYTQMLLNQTDLYEYNEETGEIVVKEGKTLYYEYDQANNGFVTLETMELLEKSIYDRISDIEKELAEDIAYVLNAGNSYIVKSEDGTLKEVTNKDPDTFGNELNGTVVYLNAIPLEFCELLGLDLNGFKYVTSNNYYDNEKTISGEIKLNENTDVTLYYMDKELYTISFNVGENIKFYGGDGTAKDPYLIGTKEQFKSIGDGLDKHYRLICDIDFKGETISPIGERFNKNGDVVYDEFTGSLDGNGFEISNLKIEGNTYSGLFGIVGERGEIADLRLYNVRSSLDLINAANRDNTVFYAGIIAGQNNGNIKYCEISSDGTKTEDHRHYRIIEDGVSKYKKVSAFGVSIISDNNVPNRNIYEYVGGIAGENNNVISFCSVENIHISGYSYHNFGGNSVGSNKNYVYAGGLCGVNCGKIVSSIVEETTEISSHAKSVLNPKKSVSSYVYSYAGGITAKTSSLDDVYNVVSEATVLWNKAVVDDQSNNDILVWSHSDRFEISMMDPYIPYHPEERSEIENSDDCTHESATPVLSAEELKKIKGEKEDIEKELSYIASNYNVTHEYENNVYEAGSRALNTDGLKIFINGEEKQYKIINVYGFNAENEKFNSVTQDIVVMFSVESDGKTLYFTEELEIEIGANSIIGKEVLNLKDQYRIYDDVIEEEAKVLDEDLKNGFPLIGLTLKYDYKVGESKYVTITNDNIAEFAFDGDISKKVGEDGKWVIERNVSITHNGEVFEFVIDVVCGHGTAFTNPESGYERLEDGYKKPTCVSLGEIAYKCQTCEDIKIFYLSKVGHTEHYENKIEPTCTSTGNEGKVTCEVCGICIREGNVIPKLSHKFVKSDDNKHFCINEGCTEEENHHYKISESVELRLNDNGSKSYYVVYKKTCVCKEDDSEKSKFYSIDHIDKNLITSESQSLPTVCVSNGYVLNGGDTVVVYVQLLNNPGIKSAVFGIRYDEGLELVSTPQAGELFKNNKVNSLDYDEDFSIDYGYNFAFADSEAVTEDGNIVKLTFKVTDKAKIGDIFNISVVYNEIGKSIKGEPIMGGFSDGDQINVVTRDGYIKVVGESQLPGDVNNDNIVDLMDAVLLAKSFANSQKYPLSIKDADIDLDGLLDPDDIVALLEYLTGGYGTNLMTPDFEIKLNINCDEDELEEPIAESIQTSIHNEDNNTYVKAGLTNPVRKGYKFLGWSYSMYTDDTFIGNNVEYQKNQAEQTLYAQWELNHIVFEKNFECKYCKGENKGKNCPFCTENIAKTCEYCHYYETDKCEICNGERSYSIYYSNAENILESISLNDIYYQKYEIGFQRKVNDVIEESAALSYGFNGWRNEAGDEYDYDKIKEELEGHCGELVLKANWSEKPIMDYPEEYFSKEGYHDPVWSVGTSMPITIIPGENDDVIISNKTYVDEESNNYVVYVTVNPIKYYVQVELNGGTPSKEICTDCGLRFVNGFTCDAEKCSVVKQYGGHSVEHPYVLKNDIVTKTGYDLVGWDVKVNGNVVATLKKLDAEFCYDKSITSDETIVIIEAKWEPLHYNLKFDSNKPREASSNINGSISDMTDCKYGEIIMINPEGLSLKGWKLIGWNTKADGSGTNYPKEVVSEGFIPEEDKNVILYAQWEQNTYTIVYNSNGGTGTMDSHYNVKYEEVVRLRENQFEKNGYVFAGWLYGSEYIYNVKYADGQSVSKLTYNDGYVIRLDAAWVEASKYKVIKSDSETYKIMFPTNNAEVGKTYYRGSRDAYYSIYYYDSDEIRALKMGGYEYVQITFSVNGKANGHLYQMLKIDGLKEGSNTYVDIQESSYLLENSNSFSKNYISCYIGIDEYTNLSIRFGVYANGASSLSYYWTIGEITCTVIPCKNIPNT